MQNPPTTSKKNEIQKATPTNLSEYMKNRIGALAAVLPKHLTPDRLMKLACQSVARTPKLMECTIQSVYLAVTQAAQFGLEPGITCHLVPFWNGRNKTFDCVFMPDYKGLIELAYRSGEVGVIHAAVVYKQDDFRYALGIEQSLHHIPARDTERKDADIIGAYAVAELTNGFKTFRFAERWQIDKVRNASKAGQSGPWVDWFPEMAQKTAIKILSKFIPRSTELRMAVALDDEFEQGHSISAGTDAEEAIKPAIFDVMPPEGEEPPTATESLKDRLEAKRRASQAEPAQEPEPELEPEAKSQWELNGKPDDQPAGPPDEPGGKVFSIRIQGETDNISALMHDIETTVGGKFEKCLVRKMGQVQVLSGITEEQALELFEFITSEDDPTVDNRKIGQQGSGFRVQAYNMDKMRAAKDTMG